MLRLIGSESATQSLLVPALPEFVARHGIRQAYSARGWRRPC